jgi:hypothetical protein
MPKITVLRQTMPPCVLCAFHAYAFASGTNGNSYCTRSSYFTQYTRSPKGDCKPIGILWRPKPRVLK